MTIRGVLQQGGLWETRHGDSARESHATVHTIMRLMANRRRNNSDAAFAPARRTPRSWWSRAARRATRQHAVFTSRSRRGVRTTADRGADSVRIRRSRPDHPVDQQGYSAARHAVAPDRRIAPLIHRLHSSAGGAIPIGNRDVGTRPDRDGRDTREGARGLFPRGRGRYAQRRRRGRAPVTPRAARRRRAVGECTRALPARLQAQREGNWALYGEEIRKLGEVLNQMNK